MENEQESKLKALAYNKKGKIEVKFTKEINNKEDLSLAYTPGVAEACKEIKKNPDAVYEYTSKWNSVAVVTDGTAVLGLGDIGPLASIPVMEGKAVLFKRFANIDAWPVAFDNVRLDGRSGKTDVEKFVNAAIAIAPQYGGINLEDIAAPACFEIEARLKQELDIPVFHDDQHGTAIVVLAAIKNYLIIAEKNIGDIRIVILGAGAAGLSIARLLRNSGAKEILICDSKGVIHSGRNDLNQWKKEFAVETEARTSAEVFAGADVFIGVSQPGIVTQDMIRSMNDNPAVFPMSNPVPEILPEKVIGCRNDAIICTGRSDYPNQLNNVLAFPFVFRGALDTRASDITEEMKIAAANAIAGLAKTKVPAEVLDSYGLDKLEFGRDYIIPKPFDSRLLAKVSAAVAEAAVKSGVAGKEINLKEYESKLRKSKTPSQ
ncbi:MAG: malic enzyme-like NAD(P)-binding protein [Nanoarchaeota archaeon]|nr:malic enzyme-like NAD(P)-binding protein [Nanoarchaeota archaeon]